MKYRALGSTGLNVSEIGFGTWGIGGVAERTRSYGPTDDVVSKRALERAFDLGVTFYDTADLYGNGHSEELIGGVFQKKRKDIVIASKVGYVDGIKLKQKFSENRIRQVIEGSLTRLKTDYIDLYQLHDASIDFLEGDKKPLRLLQKFKSEGKIRAIGLTVRSPDEGLAAVQKLNAQSIQINFNLTDQRARVNGLLKLCEKKNVGVICRSPLCFGFLTGKYGDESKLHAEDHRKRWSREQIEIWTNAYGVLAKGIKGRTNQTDAQVALRFCLSYPAISTAIPGILTPEHIEENSAASDLGLLTDEERGEVENIYKEHSFFVKQ